MHPRQQKLQEKIKASSIRDPETGCWLWNRQVSHSGYGKITLADATGTFTESAHRISYLVFVGRLYRDSIVRQTCGNRLCVNPDHLVLEGPAPGEED